MAGKRVHPALVGVTVFTAVTALGLGFLVFQDSDNTPEQVIELPEGFDESNAAPTTIAGDQSSSSTPPESAPNSSEPVTTSDAVAPDETAPGAPTGTDPEVPGEPDDGQGDPGPPVVRAPAEALEVDAVQNGNSQVWMYATLLTPEQLIAHYVGALNSDPWTYIEMYELYPAGGSSADPESWVLTATSPTADAEVSVYINSQGTVASQVEVTIR